MSQHIDKQAVAHSFSKAASHYDQFAQLQRDIGAQLYAQMDCPDPLQVVDLGCGTGYFSAKLAAQYPSAQLICFDLSEAMLAQVKKRQLQPARYQQGDIDALPFVKHSLDLIFSNLVVQWSDDFHQCMAQIKNSLKPGAKAYISTLLDGSLHELSQAWQQVDQHPHTNRFLALRDIEAQLQALHFSKVTIRTETRVLHYSDVVQVMRALKGIGANHVHGHQTSGLSGRKLIQQLEVGYQPFHNAQGQLPLSYQVCYIEVCR